MVGIRLAAALRPSAPVHPSFVAPRMDIYTRSGCLVPTESPRRYPPSTGKVLRDETGSLVVYKHVEQS